MWETTRAWRALLDGLAELDGPFLEGPRAVGDERAVVEGYRMLTTGLAVALDVYLYADPSRPSFVDVNTPFRRDRAWAATTPTPTTRWPRSTRSVTTG